MDREKLKRKIEMTLKGVDIITLKGDKGDTGPQGPIGKVGDKGDPTKEISVTNFPVSQKVHVSNFPVSKAPIVKIETEGIRKEMENIVALLSKEDKHDTEKVLLIDEDGSFVDIKKLFKALGDRISLRERDLGMNQVGFQSGGLPIAVQDALIKQGKNYATRVDDVSTTSVTYIGKAITGSTTSQAVWQIQKIDESGTPETAVITWANGSDNFTNLWTFRTSLTYT
jgi:hypothetical protein